MESDISDPRVQDQPDLYPGDEDVTAEAPSSNERAPQQNFEWIQYGDVSARRRARAHITRGFRRQKAAQSQKQKEKNEAEKEGNSARHNAALVQQRRPNVSRYAETSQPHDQGSSSASATHLVQRPLLRRTLGSGRGDPFDAFPVSLSPQGHALLDHYFFNFRPFSFTLDKRADFSPVKMLIFNLASTDPAAFHLILCFAANDIAARSGRLDSEDAIKHRTAALSLVKKDVLACKSSDHFLAAVSTLAGHEIIFGSPQTFNIHMDGLASILKVNGGLESFLETNPQLYSYISLIDYSGSCNLSSRRRFLPTIHHHELLRADPIGVPEKILRRLPTGFDLYEEVGSIIQGMHAITIGIRADDSVSQNIESYAIINHINTKLHDFISTPDLEGGTYRRRYIRLSFYILVLIYTALVSVYEGPATELFIYRFEKALVDSGPDFGNTIANLFRLLLAGEDLTSDTFAVCLLELVDVAAMMEWSSWRDVKNTLLNFFVHSPACCGQLQDLWKERMAAGDKC